MNKHNDVEKYAEGAQKRLDRYQERKQLDQYLDLLEYVVKQIKP